MKNTSYIKSLLLCFTALSVSGLNSTAYSTAVTEPDPAVIAQQRFSPDREVKHTTRKIVSMLDQNHYLDIRIDDNFSKKLLESYLEMLDPGKSHLFASDVRDFNRLKHQLDDDILSGDLNNLFNIYNIYHHRRADRISYMLNFLEKNFKEIDFNKNENLELDREHSPWLKTREEAEDLWRRLLKNDVLNILLSEESEEKALTTLSKRYKNQLRMLQQTKKDDVFEYVMSAFTHQYDPHTDYFAPQESENFDIHMSLSFQGIGAHLQREDEYTKVVKLIAGGPADNGKMLQPADRIIGVAQGQKDEFTDITGWRLGDVVSLIRGEKGTLVKLKVIPADSIDITKTKIIPIIRDIIKLEDEAAKKKIIEVPSGDKTYKIGVIELKTFYMDFKGYYENKPNYRSSTRDVENLLRELIKEKIDGLVIDLRDNGGGSLQEAINITGLFISSGPVVQIRREGGRTNLYKDSHPKLIYQGPIAVMVNRLSASASEIFAGAIQDYNVGVIIGSQTFGKGTVQTIDDMKPDPGQLKYTQAKYYRINGESTQERGIIPDILFPSLLNHDDIGESSLPLAMSWDQIQPAHYRKQKDLAPLIDYLNAKHGKRVANNPDFNYLQERISFLKDSREKTLTSLKEENRRKERKDAEARLLSMENTRRRAKGLDLLKDYAALEVNQEEEEDGEKPNDSLLEEAGNILVDWLKAKKERVALN